MLLKEVEDEREVQLAFGSFNFECRVELVDARGIEEVNEDHRVRKSQDMWLLRLLEGHTQSQDQQEFKEPYPNLLQFVQWQQVYCKRLWL